MLNARMLRKARVMLWSECLCVCPSPSSQADKLEVTLLGSMYVSLEILVTRASDVSPFPS